MMTPRETVFIALGVVIGVGVVFYQTDTPRADKCETYKISREVKVAYVLKPPPAQTIYQACPQVSQKVENDTQPELSNADDTQKKPRHHRRHRVRRYWR